MAIRDWLAAFSNDVVEVKEPVATDLEATRFLLQHPRQPVHLKDLHGGEAVGNLWSTRDRVATALRAPRRPTSTSGSSRSRSCSRRTRVATSPPACGSPNGRACATCRSTAS